MVEIKVVEDKIAKKEELTPEEKKFVMSTTPSSEDVIAADPEDQEAFKEMEDADKKDKKEDKEPPKEEKKEEKKPAEAPAAKVEPKEEASLDKVYRELDKPVGQEDLSAFSKNEKGLFWEMKRERQARQKAEQERDVLRFEKVKRDNAPKGEDKEDVKLPEIGDDDFVSGKQLKEIVNALKTKKTDAPAPAPNPMAGMQQRYMAMCDQVARSQYDDYDEVIEAANDIFKANPEYTEQLKIAMQTGDNPAIVAYHLAKGDSGFDKAIKNARIRMEARNPRKKEPPKEEAKEEDKTQAKEEAREKEKKIEENSQKAKTSGNFGGGEGGESGLTVDELYAMSESDFAKLPKTKREAILKKYGR